MRDTNGAATILRHSSIRFSPAMLASAISLSLAGVVGLGMIGTDGWVARGIDGRLDAVAERWQGGDGVKTIASGDESYWLKQHPDVVPAMFEDGGKGTLAVGARITIGTTTAGASRTFIVGEITQLPMDTSGQGSRSLKMVTARELGRDGAGPILRFVIETDGINQVSVMPVKPVLANKAL